MNKLIITTAILTSVILSLGVLAGAVPTNTGTATASAFVKQCQVDTDCTQTTLNLCTKSAGQCNGDATGTLTFDNVNPDFKGTLTTTGLTPGTTYALIYYADDWPGNHPGALIATFLGSDSNGKVLAIDQNIGFSLPDPADANYNPTLDYCLNHDLKGDYYAHCTGAKIWIIPTIDYDAPSKSVKTWNDNANYLLETDLATYTDAASIPYTCVQNQCVLKTCGISATGDPAFGNIVPGTTTSGNDISTVHNGGNTPTTELDISGTNWDNGMPVGQTSWSVDGKATWHALTLSDVSTGASVPALDSKIVNFALTVPSNAPVGATHQTITFTGSC